MKSPVPHAVKLSCVVRFALLGLTLLGAAPTCGWAQDVPQTDPELVVNSLNDTNDGVCSTENCTLREAINAANSNPDASTISFAPGVRGTIGLASALPSLGTNIVLAGHGANLLTVRRTGTANYRLFAVSSGSTVTISGLTISNGKAVSALGGGIFNQGNLTVQGCVLSGNYGDYGGGIFSDTGGTLTLQDSTFSGNNAKGGAGISSKSATTVQNSTFSGNVTGFGKGGFGGGILIEGAALSVQSCTISGNVAGAGGGLCNYGRGTTINLKNSIVALNTSTDGPDPINGPNILGPYADQGFNLIGGNPGLEMGAGKPLLKDNGGPAPTIALVTGSAAIDAGDPDFVPPPLTDQRGLPRVAGERPDIGAFEVQVPTSLLLVIVTPATTVSGSTAFPTISGHARDNGTTGIQRVEVRLYRASDGKFWDGDSWEVAATNLPTAYSEANDPDWVTSGPLPAGGSLASGTYYIIARAFNGASQGSATVYRVVTVVTPPA